MWISRIVLIIMIIASGTFASFYGGSISYAFFYMSLSIPIISLLYTGYVYTRFKLYQTIDSKTAIKGQPMGYYFQLCNEDFVTYQNIKVNFCHDRSTVLSGRESKEYCLLPGQIEIMSTAILCNVRGEYYVGVESVVITDFLYLFKITFPLLNKMKITVLPRVVQLSELKILSKDMDSKQNINHMKAREEEIDSEVRKYAYGDDRKRIHWKMSAKLHELMTRKYQEIPRNGIQLYFDLERVKSSEEERLITEDQIIESVLAISNYCYQHNIICDLFYVNGGIKSLNVQRREDFEILYELCKEVGFHSSLSVDKLIDDTIGAYRADLQYIIITSIITEELYKTLLVLKGQGHLVTLLYMGYKAEITENQWIEEFMKSGIHVVKVENNTKIEEVL